MLGRTRLARLSLSVSASPKAIVVGMAATVTPDAADPRFAAVVTATS